MLDNYTQYNSNNSLTPEFKWALLEKRHYLDEVINKTTKAEERSMIQILFRTQDIRTSRQAESGIRAKIHSWATFHCVFKIRESAKIHNPCAFSLRYQYNPFDHPRAVHSSVRGFNQNPHKPYIYWKLNNWRLWPDLFKTVRNYRVSKIWICSQSYTNP